MPLVSISSLDPKVTPESASIKAVITLIWPYSSSTRTCSLLLADQDFRLRRHKGQVRVQLTGASGQAVAKSGIGIGDEVEVSLSGAQFVDRDEEQGAKTPGKSVDWELRYGRRIAIKIKRENEQVVDIDINDPTSPSDDLFLPIMGHTPEHQPCTPAIGRIRALRTSDTWSSPAFLKGTRLSSGPFFHNPYDPFAEPDGFVEGKGRKRLRQSWGETGNWHFSARTPSPEKEYDPNGDPISDLSSPSKEQDNVARVVQLQTPVSPYISIVGDAYFLPSTQLDIQNETISEDQPASPYQLSSPLITVESSDIDHAISPALADGETSQFGEQEALSEGSPIFDDGQRIDYENFTKEIINSDGLSGTEGIMKVNTSVGTPSSSIRVVRRNDQSPGANSDEEHVPQGTSVVGLYREDSLDECGDIDFRDDTVSLRQHGEQGAHYEHLSDTEEEDYASMSVPKEHEISQLDTIQETPSEQLHMAMPPPSLPALQTSFVRPDDTKTASFPQHSPSTPKLKPIPSPSLPLPSPITGFSGISASGSYFAIGPSTSSIARDIHSIGYPAHNLKDPSTQIQDFASGLDGTVSSKRDNAFERSGTAPQSELPHQRSSPQQVVAGEADHVPSESRPADNHNLKFSIIVDPLGNDSEGEEAEETKTDAREDISIVKRELDHSVQQPERLISDTYDHDMDGESLSLAENRLDKGSLVNSPSEGNDGESPRFFDGMDVDGGSPIKMEETGYDSDKTQPFARDVAENPSKLLQSTVSISYPALGVPRELNNSPPRTSQVIDLGSDSSPIDEHGLSQPQLNEEQLVLEEYQGSPFFEGHDQDHAVIVPDHEYEAPNLSLDDDDFVPNLPSSEGIVEDQEAIERLHKQFDIPSGGSGQASVSSLLSSPPLVPVEPPSEIQGIKVEALTSQPHSYITRQISSKHGPGFVKDSEEGSIDSQASISTVISSEPPRKELRDDDNMSSDGLKFEEEYRRQRASQLASQKPAGSRPFVPLARHESLPAPSHSDITIHSSSEIPEGQHGPEHIPVSEQTSPKQTAVIESQSPDDMHLNGKEPSLSVFSVTSSAPESHTEEQLIGPTSAVISVKVEYPNLAKGSEPRSSPPEFISQPLIRQVEPSYQLSLLTNNLPITPDPSQQQADDSLSPTLHQQDAMPPTPQLTQRESTGLTQEESLVETTANSIKTETREVEATSNLRRPVVLDFEKEHSYFKRKQPNSRSSAIPDVLSTWFQPRRSSAPVLAASSEEESEHASPSSVDSDLESPKEETPQITPSTSTESLNTQDINLLKGIRTEHSFYHSLLTLPIYLNASQHPVDVLALVIRASKEPKRAEKGPRDWSTTLSISSPGFFPKRVSIRVFRPWKAALPFAERGDVVLLRAFKVRTTKGGNTILVSGESSAWVVWRFSNLGHGGGNPMFAREFDGGREEIKGPPVEFGDEERDTVSKLRNWWAGLGLQEDEADAEGDKESVQADNETNGIQGV
ncbi:hypothetical protein M501DRAFT_1000355 [Patellaria atrata CBS 101060]|uniref:Telomeric single stranded DNA binding POT1/Cdc13 domain-containing protein n=1 Tax=Patellaria atrata CBS 101060 TaxID=1346257 RepID=A0A9P4SEA8_9PEZI|nr:hypothetical protein M501DRAFT_1000355 [Patellaria atrata CBS 101060]